MQEKLSKNQLVELARKILYREGTEEESIEWMELLKRNVLHPELSNLMFYSTPPLSAEEVIERALAYRATPLPPPTRQE